MFIPSKKIAISDKYKRKEQEAYLLSLAQEEINDEHLSVEINNAFQKLSPTQSHIVNLHIHEGMTYKEIAIKCNISENTVKTHLKRAYDNLRKSLSPMILELYLFYINNFPLK